MTLHLQENISLRDLTTFKMGGLARYFANVKDAQDIPALFAFAETHGVEVMPLGKGSNFVFSDEGVINKLVAQIDIIGRDIIEDTPEYTVVKFGGGNVWDDDVLWAVEKGLSGIEAMAAIPGTTGATPVQNVGAYGQEITDTMIELQAFDSKDQKLQIISNSECKFSYRKSIFNSTERGRYLITSVTLKLSKHSPKVPEYPGVKEYFSSHNKDLATVTLKDIKNAITYIRNVKLPNPETDPNLGSFFKNAFVDSETLNKIKKEFPDVPTFPQKDGTTKISSGWLIEHAGLKGKVFGNFRVYENNALVLVHNGKGSFKELIEVRDEIIKVVKDRFGVTLQHEPNFIS